jgi:hypothetical protein
MEQAVADSPVDMMVERVDSRECYELVLARRRETFLLPML